MTTLRIHIDTASKLWQKSFSRQKQKIEEAAALAYLMAKKPRALLAHDVEIAITLTTDTAIRKLNKGYRQKDKPTNVLSFPQLQLPTHGRTRKNAKPPTTKDLRIFEHRVLPLGDVVLARQTITREAKAQAKTLESHTLHLVVHGVLHLLGYDHMNAAEAKYMEKLECDILSLMGYDDPYHANEHKTKTG